jgi:hypothetical protein
MQNMPAVYKKYLTLITVAKKKEMLTSRGRGSEATRPSCHHKPLGLLTRETSKTQTPRPLDVDRAVGVHCAESDGRNDAN